MEYLTNKQTVEDRMEGVMRSPKPVLFLDYDGTLAPFSVERDRAFPYPGVSEALTRIITSTRTRLVIVTGRPIDDLMPLLDLDPMPEIFGSHGWERRSPDGTRFTFPLPPEAQGAIEDAGFWIIQNRLEAQSEVKPASVTIHWRGLPEGERQTLRQAALEAWTPFTTVESIELTPFDGGLELRVLGQDKGNAVRTVMTEVGAEGAAAYLGDDQTDEDAFAALAREGLSVLVRAEKRSTRADLWLTPPDELLNFLEQWRDMTTGQPEGRSSGTAHRDDTTSRRLVVVSNRLPVSMTKTDGAWQVTPSHGGLVTALNPVLERSHGVWVGWNGADHDDEVDTALAEASAITPCQLRSVPLTEEEVELFYRGYSNETLWPLFHDLLGYCKFDRANWEMYCTINERFADRIIETAGPDDVIWVHDYQLCLVGQYLKRKGFRNPIIFFLHIPFPSPDLFRRLPQRRELIDALCAYDTIGVQTARDRENLVETACWVFEDAGVRQHGVMSTIFFGNRQVRVGNWPISIDFKEFYEAAKSEEVNRESWLFHEHFENRKLIFGLDRLDYTKGIPERFEAFARFLEKYPAMQGQVCLYQCVVPSRTRVADYQDLKNHIEMLVGQINGRFSRAGWVPIHYAYGNLNRRELLGRYHACEMALITPLRDGMNLVCKEFVTCCVDDRGVLVLSEFAGAAEQMGEGALLVNPFDLDKTADAIYQGLTLSVDERKRRIQHLRGVVRENDVHHWVRSIFAATGLSDFLKD